MMTTMWAAISDWYQIYVTAENDGVRGQTAELVLNKKNHEIIAAWSCTLVLPEGVTFQSAELISDCIPSGYNAEFTVTPSADGSSVFLRCEGTEGVTLYGLEDPVAVVTVAVADDAYAGECTITVKDAYLMESDGYGHSDSKQREFTWQIYGSDHVHSDSRVCIDGIYYNLSGDEAEVTYEYNDYTSDYKGFVEIPETVTYEGKIYRVTSIGKDAFRFNSGLTSVVLPESVTRIGSSAFWGCTNLVGIRIPSNVTYIGSNAFGKCPNLQYTTYNNLSYIGNEYSSFIVLVKAASKDITSCSIQEGCRIIMNHAFDGCDKLNYVNMPNTVVFIGNYAFSYCRSLESLALSRNLTYIEEDAFYDCSSLSSIYIPDGINRINGYSVFYGCDNLQYNAYDNGLYLGNSYNPYLVLVKASSTDITSCSIADGCRIICSRAFENCSNLPSITIPEGVVSIEEDAFCDYDGLTSVTIPSSIAFIGQGAIYSRNLTDVYCLAEEVPETAPNAFNVVNGNCVENATLHVPSASIESYRSTKPWSYFGTIVAYYPPVFEEEVDGIWYSFDRDARTATVTTPQDYEDYSGDVVIPAFIEIDGMPYLVTAIDDYAFAHVGAAMDFSSNITSVTIPETVSYIGEGAFFGCGLPNVLVKGTIPPQAYQTSFSEPTYYHAKLYVPNGCWYDYAFNYGWYRFLNIRETTMAEEQLSMQQAYTLMDASTFTYSVYDPVNNSIGYVSSINEDNPNHCWQVIEADGEHYLYNLGAKKFAAASWDGTLALTDTPTTIEMGDGESGIVLGEQTGCQWAFVSNDRMNVEDGIADGIKCITPTLSEGDGTFYDIQGRQVNKTQKGINIIRYSDGTSKKVLMK